jgi:hypothetical protein
VLLTRDGLLESMNRRHRTDDEIRSSLVPCSRMTALAQPQGRSDFGNQTIYFSRLENSVKSAGKLIGAMKGLPRSQRAAG